MEEKKMAPPPQHLQGRPAPSFTQHHQQPPMQQHTQIQYPQIQQYGTSSGSPQQYQANGIVHQPPPPHRPPYSQQPGPRSPLLENHQELYGTKQSSEIARQMMLREQMQLLQQKAEQSQQMNLPMSPSSYSIPSPSQDPILNAPVPPGFNASVHQAYLRRNTQQLEHQIYQNHQNAYQSPVQQSRMFQPYTNRIQQSNYASAGPSHTQILRQQYNELQQMKLHQQMQYQSQAQLQQQQTFAHRQILNQQLQSRQQSQANISQYDVSPNMNQRDSMEFNNKLRNENVPVDDYIYNSPMINARLQQKQTPQSPQGSQNNTNSANNRNIGELSSSPSSKSPSGSESRRSSSGTTQALRSPIAQRPPSAPVTMAGWLYKQGSDGLKVWRKRWFVLCEYCLFYYKTQEEDKLLGSVLLPSYQVSVCSPDDKILRKFAFKLEHTNMRTYILAAPDRDQMNQWMKMLTMASVMQEGSIRADNSTSNQHPIEKYGNNTSEQDEITPEISSGNQPMYENAPPKPRRSNEGYNSPSPDRSMQRGEITYDTSGDQPSSNALRIKKSNSGRMNATSPLPTTRDNLYGTSLYGSNVSKIGEINYHKSDNNPFNYNENVPNRITYDRSDENVVKSPVTYNDMKNSVEQQTNPFFNYSRDKQNPYNDSDYQKSPNPVPDRQNFERRTPDTYGRSIIVPGYYNKGRSEDYEDVYNNPLEKIKLNEASYRRPLSPGAYNNQQTSQRNFNSRADHDPVYQTSSNSVHQKKIPINYTSLASAQYNTVPRPHSADFLEYESKNPQNDQHIKGKYSGNISRQPPRPKSSLDINTHDYDNYYYSEASYAEKMRQSSHYLRNKNTAASLLNIGNNKVRSPDYIRPLKTSTSAYNTDERALENRYNAEKEPLYVVHDQNKNSNAANDITSLNSNWTLRNKNLSQLIRQDDNYNRSNSALSDGSMNSAMYKENLEADKEFMRSASARLPMSLDQPREGEGKREESMKRLLEWKQRMLQSPLTRKSTPATLTLARSLNQTKFSNQDRYLSSMAGQNYTKVNSKSANQIQTSYNSYSSDDEERLADIVTSEPSEAANQEQAGRSPTLPPQSEPPTIVSTIASTLTSDIFTDRPLEDPTVDNPELQNTSDSNMNSTVDSVNEESIPINKQLEYTDEDLDEVLAMYDEAEIESKPILKKTSVDQEIKIETSKCDIIKDPHSDYEVCEIKQTKKETSMKKREKIPTPPSTPVNHNFSEDHYLPMSPRKMMPSEELLHEDFLKNIAEENKKLEDNPYVEMSHGVGIESAFVNEETQAYEIVCVSNTKVEPVYMELSNSVAGKNVFEEKLSNDSDLVMKLPTKSILRKSISDSKNIKASRCDLKSPLPDILMASQNKDVKSDSSDIEDEASKDFVIQNSHSRSRFSLSDNFRPASYYLRSKEVNNVKSSSEESEVSFPPPIPVTEPPTEDLGCSNEDQNDTLILSENPDGIKERKSTSLMVYGNTPSMYDTIFKGERVKRNRVSLPDNHKLSSSSKSSDNANQSFLSSQSIPPSYKMSGNADDDSLLSYNADRGSSRMSFESDLSNKFEYTNPLEISQENELNQEEEDDFIELRHPLCNAEIEKMLKRRPLSEESCFEIESLSSTLNDTSQQVDFDPYLDSLQSENLVVPPRSIDRTKTDAKSYSFDKIAVSYLNDRVAAIREEVQYENINLSERSRSRNSNISNSTSDHDTVSTFQTVYSLRRMSNSSSKTDFNTPVRSFSRNSLPTNMESDSNALQTHNHTRHASFEQPTISYYEKNTCHYESDAAIQKNLNQSSSQKPPSEKVNISELAGKVSKSLEALNYKMSNHTLNAPGNSAEQMAPYYYSDLPAQDNLNMPTSISPSLYAKNVVVISNKLNNQRRKGGMYFKKCDIGHIHNPIHNISMNEEIHEESSLLAAAAKCVSVEFLSAADKMVEIDDKNLYESNTFKHTKHVDSSNSKNIYPQNYDKTRTNNFDEINQREKNKSLDEIIQIINVPICNKLLTNNSHNNAHVVSNFAKNQESSPRNVSNVTDKSESQRSKINNNSSDTLGEMMWDEDSLWSENLRRVSHRHAKSLEHLDCLTNPANLSGRHSVDLKTMIMSSETPCENKSKSTKISREVTYVNDNLKSHRATASKRKPYKRHKNVVNIPQPELNENDVYVQLALNSNKEIQSALDEGVYEQLAIENNCNNAISEENLNADQYFLEDGGKKKFEIDREKLRQWDLMSSGLLKNENNPYVVVSSGGGTAEGEGMHVTTAPSASMSVSTNEPSKTSDYGLSIKKSFSGSNPTLSRGSSRDSGIPVRAVSPRVRSSSAQPWNHQSKNDDAWNSPTYSQNISGEDTWSSIRSPSRQSNQPIRAVSPRIRRASDIDERTHLQSNKSNQSEALISIHNLSAGELLGRTHEELVLILIQLRRKQTSTANAIEQCCSQIKIVQNRINAIEYLEQKHENLQRLEQLKHHLLELEKHYEKSKPLVHLVDNMVKLGSLYNRNGGGGSVPSTLDRLEYNQMIREKALMEQALEQRRWAESSESLPREHIERRVEELRAMERWVAGEANTLRGLRGEREMHSEPALQQDLSRVHAMLAENSKKLEQTVAGNARLEQELTILRQKLQQQQSGNFRQNIYGSRDSMIDTQAAADATALLEDELKRVQQLVGDLQKQRQELSLAVRQLTDKSQSLGLVSPTLSVKQSYTNDYAGNADSLNKSRQNSAWVETDLDNGMNPRKNLGSSSSNSMQYTPLYIDTRPDNYANENKDMSPNVSDENSSGNLFGNLTNVEKQEIKTVRIVKRESERRQRDRERSLGNNDWPNTVIGSSLDQLIEEDTSTSYSRISSSTKGLNQIQNLSLQDNQPNGKGYFYENGINSSLNYHTKSQINPPNTLSLTNVNIPSDNISTSTTMSTSTKYLSSPSLNNNDYLSNSYGESYGISKYLHKTPISSNFSASSKQGSSHLVNYLDESKDATTHLMANGVGSKPSKNGTAVNAKGSAELSPVFTSEAARQIIIEMAEEKNGIVKNNNGSQHRRMIPKEKRRHNTAPHEAITKALEDKNDDIFHQEKWWRARDDVDMERVLRGNGLVGTKHGPPALIAPPDVVRSTLPTGPLADHYSESTIDCLLAAPNKIIIPERYVPEQAPELSPEEQRKRREKVESIKKMLSSTTPSSDPNKSPDSEDKKQREHLLQLNQILAKQVMEKSKMVAGSGADNLQSLPSPSYTHQKP